MASNHTSVSFPHQSTDILAGIVTLLKKKYEGKDYYAYERKGVWYLGLGERSSLSVDASSSKVTTTIEGKQEVSQLKGTIHDAARQFIKSRSQHGVKIFGYVGYNYAAQIRNQSFTPGRWPLLSLTEPLTEIAIDSKQITVSGAESERKLVVDDVLNSLGSILDFGPRPTQQVDLTINSDLYKSNVKQALDDIHSKKYDKVIMSRFINLDDSTGPIDMPLTLLWGRRGNTPTRSYSFRSQGREATGFSPELVMSLVDGKVVTQPLAGTRSNVGTAAEIAARKVDLLADPKEIVEHVSSVKAAVEELETLCPKVSVVVEDFMSVRNRGSCMHLGSAVAGQLSPDKDGWDALNVLFPSITASGIPKDPALQAIERIETQPRELYSGAVLILDGDNFFEATLVLRSTYQDSQRHWIQAGAGVIGLSKPERELTETKEKMGSVAPFLVFKQPAKN